MRIVFLLLDDADFRASRLDLARALRARGDEVVLVTGGGTAGDVLADGFPRVRWRLRAGSLNPLRELGALLHVARLYRRLRPDLAYHVMLKPTVYGGIAARLLGIRAVNSIHGLGFAFHGRRWHSPALRRVAAALLRASMGGRRARALFQNPDDRATLLAAGAVARGRARVVRGSGVDLARFSPVPEPEGTPLVVVASRMLREKGIEEFCRAAALVRARGVRARFALVGAPEAGNQGSLREAELARWAAEGGVERWGERDDMPAVFGAAAVVCLPSHGEGVPRSLLEACAAGRPVVATDVAGCRVAVRHGVNGIRVPVRDPEALADALERLLRDPAERARMGAAGRRLAERRFGRDAVVARTLGAFGRFFPELGAAGQPQGSRGSGQG